MYGVSHRCQSYRISFDICTLTGNRRTTFSSTRSIERTEKLKTKVPISSRRVRCVSFDVRVAIHRFRWNVVYERLSCAWSTAVRYLHHRRHIIWELSHSELYNSAQWHMVLQPKNATNGLSVRIWICLLGECLQQVPRINSNARDVGR